MVDFGINLVRLANLQRPRVVGSVAFEPTNCGTNRDSEEFEGIRPPLSRARLRLFFCHCILPLRISAPCVQNEALDAYLLVTNSSLLLFSKLVMRLK
jgi:hypothetical protein